MVVGVDWDDRCVRAGDAEKGGVISARNAGGIARVWMYGFNDEWETGFHRCGGGESCPVGCDVAVGSGEGPIVREADGGAAVYMG